MADMMKIALLFTGVNLKGNLFGSLLSNMDKVSTKMGKVNRSDPRGCECGHAG